MTPYMSMLLAHFVELLNNFYEGKESNEQLWTSCIETISKVFSSDEGGKFY